MPNPNIRLGNHHHLWVALFYFARILLVSISCFQTTLATADEQTGAKNPPPPLSEQDCQKKVTELLQELFRCSESDQKCWVTKINMAQHGLLVPRVSECSAYQCAIFPIYIKVMNLANGTNTKPAVNFRFVENQFNECRKSKDLLPSLRGTLLYEAALDQYEAAEKKHKEQIQKCNAAISKQVQKQGTKQKRKGVLLGSGIAALTVSTTLFALGGFATYLNGRPTGEQTCDIGGTTGPCRYNEVNLQASGFAVGAAFLVGGVVLTALGGTALPVPKPTEAPEECAAIN